MGALISGDSLSIRGPDRGRRARRSLGGFESVGEEWRIGDARERRDAEDVEAYDRKPVEKFSALLGGGPGYACAR